MSYIGFGIVHSQQPFTIDEFTGDGTTTVFTLSTPKPIISRAIIVTIDGIVQDPGALNSYDLDANGDLEFSEPPENLASIRALHLGRKYDLAVAMDGSVTPVKMAPDANGDFHFDTDTLYIDYLNDRIGINTSTPQHALDVVGNIHASGNITADGNITLGDTDTDSITFNADITSNILPDASSTYNLGSAGKTWLGVFADTFTGNLTGNVTGTVSDISNHTLNGLGDVNLSVAPTNGQSIIWDNATSKWIAGDSFNQSDFDTAIALKSIDVLSDVDTTTAAPTTGDALVWDGTNFAPQAPFSQNDFDTAFTAKDTDALSEGSTNLYYTDARADARVALLVDSAPATLDTLNELAAALGDDPNFATTVTNSIATKLAISDFTSTADTWIGTKSIGDLGDVDITTTAPTNEQVLVWDNANSKFIPGDAAADFTDLTGQIAAGQIPNDIITTAMMNYTVNVFSQEFTASGSSNTYTLSSDPGSKNALQVFVDGVPQRASGYTVVGTTLTLGGTPTVGQIVEVRGYGVALPVGTVADNSITGAKLQDGTIGLNKIQAGDYYAADTFTGDGNTAAYTLSTDPGSPYAVTVYVAGVWQKPITNYGVVGTTLTFTSNVPNGQEVYVRYYGVALAVGTVADASITGVKLQDGTITANKIAASEYVTQSLTGDGTTDAFTLNTDPGSQNALLVLVDNVLQTPVVNYTVSGTTLTFTSPPDNLSDIFVRFVGLPHPVATVADSAITTAKLQDTSVTNAKLNLTYTSNQYTGDNTTTDFTIASGHTVNSILVVLDGSILPPVDYSVSGTTLTFASPPLTSQSIDIRYMPV